MSRLERWMLVASTVITGLTGLVYGWMKFLMTSDDPYAIIHHPLQPLMLKIHIVAAPWMVFAIGLIFAQHVLRQLRSRVRRGRIGGLMLVLTSVPMIVSGYLIQTLTVEFLLDVSVVTHLVTGSIYLIGFGAHRVRMRRTQRRQTTSIHPVKSDREECA